MLYVYIYLIVSLIQGFLWVRRLQVGLVHQYLQQYQVVLPLPSLHALHEDPVDRSTTLLISLNPIIQPVKTQLLNISTHKTLDPHTHLLSRLSYDSRWSSLTRFSLWNKQYVFVLSFSLFG